MTRNRDKRTAADRRFVPQLEALEHRWCPSVTIGQDGDTLEIEGDDAPDTVAIVASGSIVTVSVANAFGQAAFTQTFFGIEEIEADLEGGNDTVFIHLNGFGMGFAPTPLVQAALTQNMAVIGFMAQQNFGLMASFVGFGEKELDVEIDGEDGFDTVLITSNQFRLNGDFDFDLDDVEGRALLVPILMPAAPGQPATGQPVGFFPILF